MSKREITVSYEAGEGVVVGYVQNHNGHPCAIVLVGNELIPVLLSDLTVLNRVDKKHDDYGMF